MYLNKVTGGSVGCIAANLEFMESCSSMKDRSGYNMIIDGKEKGVHRPRQGSIWHPLIIFMYQVDYWIC